MHLASLNHDEVMNEVDIHRDVDSVNARYGNLIAIVAGDYLMARSATIAADLGADAAGLLARTLARHTRGQVCEVRTAFSIERTEADYFEAIEGKTASLIAASCRMGALTARLDERETAALTEFGRCFGILYQLRDDILDVVATENELGKPPVKTSPKGSITCPPSSHCATPTWAMSCATCSGHHSTTTTESARASSSSQPTPSRRRLPARRVTSPKPIRRWRVSQ